MENMETGLQVIAEKIQNECHTTVELVKAKSKEGNFDYQDATNVFIFRKLAELQLQINILKQNQTL